MVDPGHHIGDVPLARSGQDDLGDARRQEVPAQPRPVPPLAGVVDQDGVADAVLGVVDAFGSIRVDDADHVAVGDDGVLFLINGDDAVERPVDRVAAQQTGALEEVIRGTLPHDGGLEAEFLAAAGLLDEDAGQQAADAAEPVEDDVLRFIQDGAHTGVDAGQFPAHVGFRGQAAAFGAEVEGQLAQVDARRSQIQLADRLQQGP